MTSRLYIMCADPLVTYGWLITAVIMVEKRTAQAITATCKFSSIVSREDAGLKF
jgi:hypothetical protein